MPPARLLYLVEFLLDVGPTSVGALGNAPVTQFELRAWAANMNIRLTPWEASVVCKLSVAYVVQLQKAESPDCLPPWEELAAPTREEVSRKIDDYLR